MFTHEAITHVHTEASSGPASALDPVILTALRDVFGPGYESRWKECFTAPAELAALLAPGGTVGLLFITDHVNERAHALHPEALSLAAQDPRIAVGVEMQTWLRDAEGMVRRAPELLIYGRTQRARTAGRPYFGVSEEDLSIIFKECCVDETGRADLLLTRDFCLLGGYAHALAHPFDGADLPLGQLLDVVTGFKFVETVNGGFPAASSRRLQRFLSWYNDAATGRVEAEAPRSDLLRAMARKARETGPLHPWGGSDAHVGNHDRVVIVYAGDEARPDAGRFIADMVGPGARCLLEKRVFTISGVPATPLSLLDDVTKICILNLRNHWELLRGRPDLVRESVARIQKITARELARRRRDRKRFIREFDAAAGLEILEHRTDRRRVMIRAAMDAPHALRPLPDRIP